MNDINKKQIQIEIAIAEIEKRVRQKVGCFCVQFDDNVLEETIIELKKIEFFRIKYNIFKPKQIIVTIDYRKLQYFQNLK